MKRSVLACVVSTAVFPLAAFADSRPVAVQFQTITSSFFNGAVAVDSESNAALIGLNNGTVAVTKRSALGAWSTGVTLTGTTSSFGNRLAFNGGWAMIAEDQSARTVRVYEYVSGVFTPREPITNTQVQVNALFGARIAISDNGRFAVISAFDYDDVSRAGDDHGIAFVYQRFDAQWSLVQALTAGTDSISNGKFGQSLAISSDGRLVAVSGIGSDDHVHIFKKNELTGVYAQEKNLTWPTSGTGFGWSLDLSEDGQTLIVGMPFAFSNAGGVFLYRRNGGAWDLINGVNAPTVGQHQMGWAVAVTNGLATTATLAYQGAPAGPTTAFFAWGNDLERPKVWSVPNSGPSTTLFAPTAARVDLAIDGPWIFVGIQSVNALPEVVIFSIFTPPPTLEDLIADFGSTYGLWRLRLNSWTPVHGLTAEQVVRADIDSNGLDDLIVDFGSTYGVWAWKNHATWSQLNTLSPRSITAGDVDDNGVDDLILDFDSYGIWILKNGFSWVRLHPANASHIAVSDLDEDGRDEVIIDFPGQGIWIYGNNSTWYQLHVLNARSIATADLDGFGRKAVIVDFGGPGIYAYRDLGPFNTTWTQINPSTAAHIAVGDLDGNGQADLVIDFGAQYGIWALRNKTTWTQVHPFTAEAIIVLERNGGYQDDVVVDFGPTYGLWEWTDGNAWSLLHAISPNGMTVGRFQ